MEVSTLTLTVSKMISLTWLLQPIPVHKTISPTWSGSLQCPATHPPPDSDIPWSCKMHAQTFLFGQDLTSSPLCRMFSEGSAAVEGEEGSTWVLAFEKWVVPSSAMDGSWPTDSSTSTLALPIGIVSILHSPSTISTCQVWENNGGNSGCQVRTYEVSEGTSASAYVLHLLSQDFRMRRRSTRDRRIGVEDQSCSWSGTLEDKNWEEDLFDIWTEGSTWHV